MKEIKEDPNKWRDTLYSWIERLSLVKMSILPELPYKLNAVPTKVPADFFFFGENKAYSNNYMEKPMTLNC